MDITMNGFNYDDLKLKKNEIMKQMYKLKEELKVLNDLCTEKLRKEKANEYSKKLMKNKYHTNEEFKERRKQKALEYYYEKKKKKEAEVEIDEENEVEN
jgi:hypothetical protein